MADEEPRWLSAEEQDAWVPLAVVLRLLPSALDAQLKRDANLTFYDYVVLAVLSQVGGDGVRMSDLAALSSGGQPRLSQVVTRMEERAWVERRPHPDDGRATLVALLPAGRAVLAAAAPGHVATVRELVFDQLSPTEVHQLERIATRLASALTPPDSLLATRETFRPDA